MKTGAIERFQSFAQEVRESFSMALSSIAAHKLRSCLTLLGVLVGVFSIILVMTAIRVLQNKIETALNDLGSNAIQIQRFPAIQFDDEGGSMEKFLRRKEITLIQVNALRDRATLAKTVSIRTWIDQGEIISDYAKTNPDTGVCGMTPDAFEALNLLVDQGRALMQPDLDGSRDVCVLGASVARVLYPMGGAVGNRVKHRGIHYTIVGVMEAKGSLFGNDPDAFMAIPITTALNRFNRRMSLEIQVQAWDQKSMDDLVEQCRGILRASRKVEPGKNDDFEIFSSDSLINTFRGVTLAVRVGAAVISSIALLAAGIGIMNIMLVSVTERTREIGIRRAVGAKKRNIMTQFILEAVALCQIGGIGGVILGILTGNIAAYLLEVPPAVPLDWAAFGLFICTVVGVVFGVYPAYKAANLDPIDSLRYE